MGGHSAWRKRVARGELAKGSGGAILRHRPRLGRKGKDMELNRKGNIAGGNPKKKKKRKGRDDPTNEKAVHDGSIVPAKRAVVMVSSCLLVFYSVALLYGWRAYVVFFR